MENIIYLFLRTIKQVIKRSLRILLLLKGADFLVAPGSSFRRLLVSPSLALCPVIYKQTLSSFSIWSVDSAFLVSSNPLPAYATPKFQPLTGVKMSSTPLPPERILCHFPQSTESGSSSRWMCLLLHRA